MKIAIIDEGFANWTEAQNKSEVPTKMEIVASRDYHGGQTGDVYSGTSKHGTLVTAAVYDIAPEASYYLVKVHNGDDLITPEEEFNQAIRDLLDVWGIDIVVMSVSFRQEDFFYGTGRLSRALFAPSTSQGRAWFIAAGNQAYLHLRQDPLNGTMSTRLTKSPDDVSFKPYVTWNSWNFTNCHQNNNPPPSYGVVINDENGLPLRTRNDPRECIDITDPEHEFSPIPWLDNDFVDIIVSKHGNGAQGVEVKLFTTGTTGTLGNFSNEESIGPLAADANVLSITGANRTFYNSPLIPSGTPEVHPYSYGPTTDDRAKPDVAAPGGGLG